MKITGYGAGLGQPGGGRDRAAAFRSRHSIGQRIKGRILRREHNGLFWVQVGGEELLASLEVQAEPGDQLVFIVTALEPEIRLQALGGGQQAGDVPGLVQRFRSARETFETHSSTLLAPLAALPPQALLRQEAFDRALTRDAATLFAKVLELLAQINAALPGEQQARALYLPWLTPGLRRQEMLRRAKADGSAQLALSAEDTACGLVEARLDTSPPRLRLAAQRPEAGASLAVELCALAREQCQAEPLVLGPSHLVPSGLGGVLGELFGAVPAWTSGGLNTRV